MVALLAISLGLGLGAGALARGRLANLREVLLRVLPLLMASRLVGMLPLFVGLPRGPRQGAQLLSLLGVLAFLGINLVAARGGVRAGFVTLLAGWALNFVVIAANGGMPLSLWAWSHSGQRGAPTPGEGGFFKIVLAEPGTALRFLGDVVPIRAIDQVVSVGDLVLMAGIAVVIAAGMRARAAAPQP
jgi:hypothetical protein